MLGPGEIVLDQVRLERLEAHVERWVAVLQIVAEQHLHVLFVHVVRPERTLLGTVAQVQVVHGVLERELVDYVRVARQQHARHHLQLGPPHPAQLVVEDVDAGDPVDTGRVLATLEVLVPLQSDDHGQAQHDSTGRYLRSHYVHVRDEKDRCSSLGLVRIHFRVLPTNQCGHSIVGCFLPAHAFRQNDEWEPGALDSVHVGYGHLVVFRTINHVDNAIVQLLVHRFRAFRYELGQ